MESDSRASHLDAEVDLSSSNGPSRTKEYGEGSSRRGKSTSAPKPSSSAASYASGQADGVRGSETFAKRVEALVAQIPTGRVMTYGQLAAMAGNARAARIVGGIAHFGDPDLPWQRVVNKQGGLAAGYPGGRAGHKEHLESEGVEVHGSDGDYSVNIGELLWEPNTNKLFE